MQQSTLLSTFLLPASSRPWLADKPAMIMPVSPVNAVERVITYAQFERLVDCACHQFSSAGITTDSVIVTRLYPFSPVALASILAAWKLSAMVIPLDARITDEALKNAATGLKANLVLSHTPLEFPNVLSPNTWLEESATCNFRRGIMPAKVEGIRLGICTSGTTGMPKCADLELLPTLNNVVEMTESVDLNEGTRAISVPPSSHIFGLLAALAALLRGGCLILVPPYTKAKESLVPFIEKYQVDTVILLPSIYGELLAEDISAASLASVTAWMSGGAALPDTTFHKFKEKTGREIIQGYGATETEVTATNKGGPVGSVGKALPSAKFEIVNDKLELLSPGQIGQIRIAAPTVMRSYRGQPEKTAKVLMGGWYYTGDLGCLDENGYLFVKERMDDQINFRGNKVLPSDVENVLLGSKLAKEVAVFGVPDPKLEGGELVKAIIVINDLELSEQLKSDDHQKSLLATLALRKDFRTHCEASKLRPEEYPQKYEFWPADKELPQTKTRKTDKKALKALSASQS